MKISYGIWLLVHYISQKINVKWYPPLVHTCTSVVLLWTKSYNVCLNLSLGYFCTHLIVLFWNAIQKRTVNNFGFVVHHIVSIYILDKVSKEDDLKPLFYKSFESVEYSNLFINFYPLIINTFGEKSIEHKIYVLLEAIMYSYFRVFRLGEILKEHINLLEKNIQICFTCIYLMGFYWSTKLIRNLQLSNV